MSKFQAVLFDLDGTLIDSGALVVEAMQSTFADYGLPVPGAAEIISYMGIPIEVYFQKLGGEAYQKLDETAVFATYRASFKALVEAGRLEAFAGIADMLAALKGQNIATGIVTSKTTAPAIHSCEAAGLMPYLDAVVGSDLVTAYKPAPDTVYKCLELLNLTAGPHICVVGDAEGDIGMGRDAGCVTCGVTWGAHDAARLESQRPDHIASSLAELSNFIGL